MTISLTIKNGNAVIRSLAEKEASINSIVAYALGQTALEVQNEIKLVVVSGGPRHAPGTPTTAVPGGPPSAVTGNLQRSVTTEMTAGFPNYKADIFPTAIYSRAVDMGKPEWGGVKYPYMQKAYNNVAPRVNVVFSNAFARRWKNG